MDEAMGHETTTGAAKPSRIRRKLMAGVVAGAAVPALFLGGTADAIVPGPNGRIVFESNRGGNTNIYTMNPDGSVVKNLTPATRGSDVFPAWAPKGNKISFTSDRAEAGNPDIYTMNTDGSDVTRLTDAPGEDRGTSWTSEGNRIIFHSARDRDATHTFDIFSMKHDGTDQRKLFTNGSAAYVCGDRINGTIVFNSNGNPLGTNPLNPPVGTNPNPAADFEIFTMDMRGNNVRQITNNAVLDSGPKWSPDCSMISYNSAEVAPGRSLDIHRINADGTGDVNLTNTPDIFDAFSAWSPDGTRIVFSSNRDVNFEIYTMNSSDGSDVQRLTFTDFGLADFRPDWGTSRILIDTDPTTVASCKDGGWRSFVTMATAQQRFDNQVDCVNFVRRQVP